MAATISFDCAIANRDRVQIAINDMAIELVATFYHRDKLPPCRDRGQCGMNALAQRGGSKVSSSQVNVEALIDRSDATSTRTI
jgi:hypothetical protein